MTDKFLSFLGIARKAGRLFLGMDTIKDNILRKNISLVMVTSNISKSSLKKINKVSMQNNAKIVNLKYSTEDIYSSIGKYAAIIGVSDENFIIKFKELLEESQTNLTI